MTPADMDWGAVRVIAACLGRRYSGINASMLAVIPEQLKREKIAAFGFRIPAGIPQISLRDLWTMRQDRWRVWHARRNVDMLAGLAMRHLFGFRFKLLFTSAAQRRHRWLTRFCYHRMDAVIATTDGAAAFLDRPATVVRHGVDTHRFHPPADRSAAWRATGLPGRYGVGVFGRIRPNKGSEDFADALGSVLPHRPDWTAVFVGEATREHRDFEQRIRDKLGARAHFTGFVSDGDIPSWYRALSVVVCPSRVEGFGLPCLEAMASGCPVVATRTGAWPEIIESGVTGALVDCGHVRGLATALLNLTENPVRISEMGNMARQHVANHFAVENEAKGIQQIYDALIGTAS